MRRVLRCSGVCVDYGTIRAISDLDLAIGGGETVAVLGPSGSGKSTLMYAIAGFVEIARGEIAVGDEMVSSPSKAVAPEKRPVGVVFQNYALWPHLTAVETVAYPLRRAGTPKSKALREASELLDKVGIADVRDRKPAELSGGQQQRVGLARALARTALIYLFDEPTAHLDPPVRAAVEDEIRTRRRETGAAALYSTHDSVEALAIADRVAVLRQGRIVQVDSPIAVYERPADVWAARLTGPVASVTVRPLGYRAGKAQVELGETTVSADAHEPPGVESAALLVRPEWVSLDGKIKGVVREVSFRGPHTDYSIDTPHGDLVAREPGPPRLAAGDTCGCAVNRGWIPAPGPR